jgi:energy-coupling factor transport system permease protein
MIRDITIGQYYPTNSVIHRLDPRVKLIGTIVYIVSLFLFGYSFWGYLLTGTFLIGTVILSKIPVKYILKGLKAVIFLLLFTVSFNLFLTQGETIWKLGFLKITKEGLTTSAFMAIRLVSLILGSSLMTFTTTPNQLTDGIERLLSPLKVIRVPVHEVAMMMSIALRFIPILLEETDKIMKAQQARGADFESGGLIKRAKSMVPILVPLFISAFRRAGDLAMAMEARCYRGGKGRTKMKPLKYKVRDSLAFLSFIVYIATIVILDKYMF